jgi:hypothetical protein
MLKSALLVTVGIVVGAGAISALHAQNNAPHYAQVRANRVVLS